MAYRGDIGNKEQKAEFTSLLPSQKLNTITLEEALQLFQYPRVIAAHEGKEVVVNRGQYGPYVALMGVDAQGKDKRELIASLQDGDDPATITKERALSLLYARKEFLDNRNIADLGGGIKVLNGKYGPYVTDGKRHASIPKGTDPKMVDKAEAIRLMDEREANPPKQGGGKGKWKGKGGKFRGKKGGGKSSDTPKDSPYDDLPM
jgi:DNA topoisomerase I